MASQLAQDWLVPQLLLLPEQSQPSSELQSANSVVEPQLRVCWSPQLLLLQHVEHEPETLP